MLRLLNVRKRYKLQIRDAVDNVSLHVKPGEIFGFLGPNGAGKTTTIKLILGLLHPDTGQIVVNGHDVAQDPVAAKAQIGFCPDTPQLYERLTGIEYLQLIADVRQVDAATRQTRIQHFGAMFDLTHALPDVIQSYSHGMKQKLAIMAALIAQPPLLLLDEPMVGLDPKANHLFKQTMQQHCAGGNTVFFSTHILEVAERLCDRVGIIQRGRLIAVGTPDELRSRGTADSTLESIFLELTASGDAP